VSAPGKLKTPFGHDLIAATGLFVLCAITAIQRPLFHDETSTWYFAGGSILHLFQQLRQDVHPPAYFLLASGYFHLFGPAFVGLRLVSCACACATVLVLLAAMRLWFPARQFPVLRWYLATCPFLVFVAYFARYYALVLLLSALCLYAVALYRNRPAARLALAAGVVAGLVLLTNYVAGFVAAFTCVAMVASVSESRRRLKQSALCACAALVVFAPVVPLLVSQLQVSGGERMAPLSVLLAGQFVKTAVYLVYCFTVGDGLPPWTLAGLAAGFAGVLICLWGLLQASRVPSFRRPVFVCCAVLATACLGATILMPASGLLFVPPRFAFAWLAWVLLGVGLPEAVGKLGGGRSALLLITNFAGLVGLLMFRQTTNWAYQLPIEEITRSIKQESLNSERATLWLPARSMSNVLLCIDQELPNLPVNPTGPARVQTALVLHETREPSWPPSAATRSASALDPPGEWRAERTYKFIPESKSAGRLKALVAGRSAYPHKLELNVFVRAE
jgi:hypothetical protein